MCSSALHHFVSRKSFRSLQDVTKYILLRSYKGGIDSIQNFWVWESGSKCLTFSGSVGELLVRWSELCERPGPSISPRNQNTKHFIFNTGKPAALPSPKAQEALLFCRRLQSCSRCLSWACVHPRQTGKRRTHYLLAKVWQCPSQGDPWSSAVELLG